MNKNRWRNFGRYWEAIAEARKKKLAAKDKEKQDLSLYKGNAEIFLSVRGGLTLALRRALSLAAAHSMGMALGMDFHGTTVAR